MSSNIYLIGLHHQDIDGADRMSYFLDKTKPKIIAIEWDHIRDANTNLPDHYPSLEEIINQSKYDLKKLEQDYIENKEYFEEAQKETYELLGLDLNPEQMALDRVTTHLIEKQIPVYLVCIPKQYAQTRLESELYYIDLPRENTNEIGETYEIDRVEGIKAMTAELDSLEKKYILEILSSGFDNWLEILRKTIAVDYEKEKLSETFEEIRKDVQENGGDAYSQAVYDPEREKYMGKKIRALSQKNQGSLVAFVGLGHLLRLYEEIKNLNPAVLTLAECGSV